jgi:phasin family protein
MMNINPFFDVNKASVDTLFALTGQALHGVEQLAALNLQAIKTLLAECAEGTQVALSGRSPEDLVKLQTATLLATPQKAAAYGRQVQEIFATLAAGQRAAVEAQATDVQAKFLDAVNDALKNVPGSDNVLAMAKSAIAAANMAYDGVNKASKQVSDAVAANLTKVTETAVKTSRSSRATVDA